MLDDGDEEGEETLINQHKSSEDTARSARVDTQKKVQAISNRKPGPSPPPKPAGPPTWLSLAAKLPVGQDQESTEARINLFSRFDPNGNGKLSLAEVDKGLLVTFQLNGGDEFATKRCKPAIMRAFQAAKDVSGKGGKDGDVVTRGEFRCLLIYLQRYFSLLALFDEVDTSDDRRVDLDEFTKAVPKLREWGVEINDPAADFQLIDLNGGGHVLFDEFAVWALNKGLDKLEGVPRRLKVVPSPRPKFELAVEPVAPTPDNPIMQYIEMSRRYKDAVTRAKSQPASPRRIT